MPKESNRRRHLRIDSSKLPPRAVIRIPNRPPIALIDLSTGGALLELPFPLQPESRVTLELLTSAEHVAIPFQLLRCYVADLKDGVRYHAAGVFPQSLKFPATFVAVLSPASSERLIATLEGFLQKSHASNLGSGGLRFNDLLSWVVNVLRGGEPANLISAQVKARLAQQFPSLAIEPASASFLRDPARSARFFGLDFKANLLLTMSDRRFLRACAQLITLFDRNSEPPLISSADDDTAGDEAGSSLVIPGMARPTLGMHMSR